MGRGSGQAVLLVAIVWETAKDVSSNADVKSSTAFYLHTRILVTRHILGLNKVESYTKEENTQPPLPITVSLPREEEEPSKEKNTRKH